jgi:uncharacterized SAM-binding protein YcdF (DUF218 family)
MLDMILASLVYPLGFALVWLVVALGALALGARRAGGVATLLSVAVLWIASMPMTSQWAITTLESQYPVHSVNSLEAADVAIVLGGAISPPDSSNPYVDLSSASDRVFHAYRLLKSGKVTRILLSGGNIFDDGRTPEAKAMAEFLTELGIDRRAILIEPTSRNTHENAIASSDIWRAEGFKTGLLVTSALHMPRALAAFEKMGLRIYPATIDTRGGGLPPFPLNIIPDVAALSGTTAAMKEWVGLLIYRLRGWA